MLTLVTHTAIKERLNMEFRKVPFWGPILFHSYLNALFDLPLSGDIVSFTDDTAIIYTDSNWASLKAKAELDFKNIIHFFNTRLLTINCKNLLCSLYIL